MLGFAFATATLSFGLELDVGELAAGTPVDLLASGCAAGLDVEFYLGPIGPGPCPAVMGGLCFDLRKPKFLGRRACIAGTAAIAPMMPLNLGAGREVAFQAVSYFGAYHESSPPVTRWVDTWWHRIAVDGVVTNEWVAGDEDFATTTPGVGTTWLTWDTETLYVAAQHPDVVNGGGAHWLVIYVGDGAAGSTTGVTYNTQTPALAVPFSHQVRWKADNTYNSLMTWDGTAWLSTDFWLGTEGSLLAEMEIEQTVELAIPWASVGVTRGAVVHVAWLYEGANFETTYAGVPSSAFADGYDPDVLDFVTVDLASAVSPVGQN